MSIKIHLSRYKAVTLFDELGWLETCGRHKGEIDVDGHCAEVEVEAFGMWLNKNTLY